MSWTSRILGSIRKYPVTSSVFAGIAGTQIGDWLDISPGDALSPYGDDDENGEGGPDFPNPLEDLLGKAKLAVVAGAVGIVGLIIVAGTSMGPRRIG